MYHRIHIQNLSQKRLPVKYEKIKTWVTQALSEHQQRAELSIRFTTQDEIHHANKHYRDKDKPTNVLAFEAQLPKTLSIKYRLLGDLMVCPDILKAESLVQNKKLESHWAHIIVHGVLHLLGFDHIKKADEKQMQAREIQVLAQLGYDNPYVEEESNLE